MNISMMILLVSIGPKPIVDAQTEYEKYLTKFEKCEAITGAMVSTGGPVSQPTVTTFRVAKGGRYALFRANTDEHFDGKQAVVYSPSENKYRIKSPSNFAFALAFGARFTPGDVKYVIAVDMKETVVEEREIQTFTLRFSDSEQLYSLMVRKKDGRPLSLTTGGNQSSYTTNLPELHFDRKLREQAWEWTPPRGAVKTEFLSRD